MPNENPVKSLKKGFSRISEQPCSHDFHLSRDTHPQDFSRAEKISARNADWKMLHTKSLPVSLVGFRRCYFNIKSNSLLVTHQVQFKCALFQAVP